MPGWSECGVRGFPASPTSPSGPPFGFSGLSRPAMRAVCRDGISWRSNVEYSGIPVRNHGWMGYSRNSEGWSEGIRVPPSDGCLVNVLDPAKGVRHKSLLNERIFGWAQDVRKGGFPCGGAAFLSSGPRDHRPAPAWLLLITRRRGKEPADVGQTLYWGRAVDPRGGAPVPHERHLRRYCNDPTSRNCRR